MFLGWVSSIMLVAAFGLQAPTAQQETAPVAAEPAQEARLTPIQFGQRADQEVRWDRGVCVGVSGLSQQSAQFVADRVSQRAREVGLRAGGPGCRANVVILVTDDPNGVARAVTQSRDFAGTGRARTRGRAENFTNSRDAIRWWYVWQEVTDTGEIANSSEHNRTAPEVRVPERGRLGQTTRLAFTHSVIIADSRQITGVQMNALADYIAMAALAQIDAESTGEGQPSILTLFSDHGAGRTPPAELTSWDRARLQTLYNIPR